MNARLLVAVLLLTACRRPTTSTADAAAEVGEGGACVATRSVSIRRASLPGTRRGAYDLVRALGSKQGPALAASLRPDSEDYAAVFDATLAGRVEEWAARFWDALEESHAVMLNDLELAHVPTDGRTEITLFGLTPEMLARPGSELCGRAYATSGIQKHLAPTVGVYCYGFHAVEDTTPHLADALVYVRGHWAFFPHPNDLPKTVYAPTCPPRVTTDNTSLLLDPPSDTASDPSSPGAAHALLGRMIGDADAAHAELAKLEPSLADVKAVYREPAASRLYAAMKPKWDAVRRGGDYVDSLNEGVLPRSDVEIVSLYASRPETIGTDASNCPIGYRQVSKDLLPNIQVYCFTFSRIGLGGMSMDGLVFARGHWVLIPRPWELLAR